MTTVTIDPAVATRIRVAATFADMAPVVGPYEDGELLVAERADLGISAADLAFVRSLPCPPTDVHWIKKAGSQQLLAPLTKQHPLRHFFPSDKVGARRLQWIIRAGNAAARAAMAALFPHYRVIHEHITWRLTATAREPLHLDYYRLEKENDWHSVRLFYNLDDQPREWGVGARVWDIMRAHPDLALAAAYKHSPNVMNDVLSGLPLVADGPRHRVSFAPGAAWLVNSQVVAHEIVGGRRLLAATFFVDPTSAADPGKVFAASVRRILKELPCVPRRP